jgi:hypothetical protein
MKIRMLALAGVAAVALSAPARAGDGWYLGLGGGYDSMSSIHTSSPLQHQDASGSHYRGLFWLWLGFRPAH